MTQRSAPEYRDLRGHPYEWAEAQIKLEGYTVGRADYRRGKTNIYHNRGADVYVFVGSNNLVKDVRWNLYASPENFGSAHYRAFFQVNQYGKFGNHQHYQGSK